LKGFSVLNSYIACHLGMARPRITDGGDGIQIWMVAIHVVINGR